MKFIHTITLLFIACLFFSCAKQEKPELPLIPQPQKIKWSDGWSVFKNLKVEAEASFKSEIITLNKYFPVTSDKQSGETLTVHFVKGAVENPHKTIGAYQLSVGKEVIIKAADATGIFYGIQTLRQLVRKEGGQLQVAQCNITDWPVFKIRGLMHDVGRNYISPGLLKEQLEVMAAYKYNIFHFHLTDDPGWRLESKIYPELQSEKATSRKPGKYYSQEEFIDLVKFCADRHITIIPEFDIPGHSKAFRKALGINSMNSPKVQNILLDLIDELCSLVPAEQMPYVHLGTDEVRNPAEYVGPDFLQPLIDRVEQNNRKYISWWHGMISPGDTTSIKQLWAQHEPLEGHPFIDSRANYINHLDPLAGMCRLFFQQPCRQVHGDDTALGGILCLWNDNRVEEERNLFIQNPVYPALVLYSDAIWNGKKDYEGKKYWAQMPEKGTPEYNDYRAFEDKLIAHRDLYFEGKEFPYVKHAHIPWKIIGPFDHKGDLSATFPVKDEIKDEYSVDGKTYVWSDSLLHGGTVHLRHFFGFPAPVKEKQGTVYAMTNVWSPKNQKVAFWISFQGWSRSSRRGGPLPDLGQWHTTNPRIWVNDREIAPPKWKQPGLAKDTPEIPFVDEDYFYREPSKVQLKEGWNKILLKIPHGGSSWKWMFTCVPVEVDGNDVREVEGLKFMAEIKE